MLILMRGGGDLASGIALRLHRCGFKILITELAEPLVVRRLVSFAEAVYEGAFQVEDVYGERIDSVAEATRIWSKGRIPVLIDPDLTCLKTENPEVVVDARMRKKPPEMGMQLASLTIGLGPGFVAGENCHAAIETNRGHHLGQVLWEGAPEPDTGIPGDVIGYTSERVLRSPATGVFQTRVLIGHLVDKGEIIAEVKGATIKAPFRGVVRGLLRNGSKVHPGMKVGDVDPRGDPAYARIVSDKARSLGGAVLEAILSRSDLRDRLWI